MGRMDVKMKQVLQNQLAVALHQRSGQRIHGRCSLLFAFLEFSVSANVGSELRASFDRALRSPLTRGHPTIEQPWRCALQQFSPCSAKCKKNLSWKLHQKKERKCLGWQHESFRDTFHSADFPLKQISPLERLHGKVLQ